MKIWNFCLAGLFFILQFKGALTAEERLSSAPYISGDTFRAHCDYIFDETNNVLDPEKIVFGDTIFVKTDFIPQFFEDVHPRIAQPYVLVSHNSDFHVPGNYGHMLSDAKLLAWFGQNVEHGYHPKLHPVPIGIANRRWPHGRIETFNHAKEQIGRIPKTRLLYMNFALENNFSVRSVVYKLFVNQPYCFVSSPKSHLEYLIDMAMSQFVLSPRGNGIDCHRTWEALYMGGIPIVTTSTLNPLFEDLPVVIIDNWQQVTPSFLEQQLIELNNRSFRWEKLWAGYWFKQIDAYKTPYPIQFSIPECKVVREIPQKTQDFAFAKTENSDIYVYNNGWEYSQRAYSFNNESEYYKDYQRSYFAITCKKGGWDTMRHYEILANGCIPYFLNLEECDFKTMPFLPRELIQEAMHLEGVSLNRIDHGKFDKKRYFEILDAILKHVSKYLTTRGMAQYLLDRIGYSGSEQILYLSEDPRPDYLRCCTLIGLKEILGDKVVDVPKISHIYKNYPGNPDALYGKGFSYTKIVDDLPIDRENIEQRIRNKEFAFIIYGSVHRGLRFHNLVTKVYDSKHIVYLCGEDTHSCQYSNWPNLFLREAQNFDPSAPKLNIEDVKW